jgi:hypothetical protein
MERQFTSDKVKAYIKIYKIIFKISNNIFEIMKKEEKECNCNQHPADR